jgi:hypothetical protein
VDTGRGRRGACRARALVRERTPGVRFALDLHDAYGAADFARVDDAEAFAETSLPTMQSSSARKKIAP